MCPAGRALTRIEVRTSAGPVPATVAWWRDEPAVDVALLLITDPAWPQPRWRRPIRWGRFVTEQPGQECQAVGFPDVVAEPRYPESHHAVGVVNPGSLLKSGLQAIEVRDPPGRRTADGSAWAGMSGAAVCSGPLVVGVVALDPAGFDGRRLVATPVAAVVGNPGFADLVAAHCGRPPHLEPVELAALGEPVAEPTSPAGLSRADVATTPFRPRPELDQLREWAHSPEWSSLRLVTGPGGQGKSRLARQLATDLRADQWATVVLADHTTPEQLSVLSNLTTPTLVVLDYAESRIDQLDAVLARLEAAETRTRVLLLARTGGSWRTERIRPSPRLQVLSDDRIVLPLGPSSAPTTAREPRGGRPWSPWPGSSVGSTATRTSAGRTSQPGSAPPDRRAAAGRSSPSSWTPSRRSCRPADRYRRRRGRRRGTSSWPTSSATGTGAPRGST